MDYIRKCLYPEEDISEINNKPISHATIYNTGISEEERFFLKKRLPVVKAALQKMLNQELTDEQIPKIALIGSGGGYRAMLCTTGSLCAADKINLLDATTYMPVLSGSTWAVAPWITTGKPIQEFKTYIQECATKSFTEPTLEEALLIFKALKKKYDNKQSLTLVEPYGALLANRLLEALEHKRQKATLSEQAQKIETGAYPYPIYTAIDGRETVIVNQTWSSITAHTVRDHTNNIHIPTSTYGKKYKKGQLIDENASEKTLADFMGTWGSAFGASIHDIIEELVDNHQTLKIIFDWLPDSIEGDRILPFYATIPNYMYKMENIKDVTLIKEKEMMLVDAGLDINLPYPPVSGICPERKADILIFLDASAGQIGEEFQKVVDYAQLHNLPFPKIDFENIDKKTINIFKDEHDKNIPVVIYMPRISDNALWEINKSKSEFADYNLSGFDLDYQTKEGYCATQHFQYLPEHSQLVTNQTEFNMLVNKDKIIETIRWWINRT